MADKGKFVDQRKEKRYQGIDGTLAAILTPDMHSYTRLGEIIDISESGLAFQYVGRTGQRKDDFTLLDIFAYKGTRAHLEKLPCRIVYDLPTAADSLSLRTRRCGLQFGELSSLQLSELSHFIAENTRSEG
jgi:hypothetical protein